MVQVSFGFTKICKSALLFVMLVKCHSEYRNTRQGGCADGSSETNSEGTCTLRQSLSPFGCEAELFLNTK